MRIENKKEIVKLRAVGYNNKEIAQKLGLPPSTVSYNLKLLKEEAEKGDIDGMLVKFIGLDLFKKMLR